MGKGRGGQAQRAQQQDGNEEIRLFGDQPRLEGHEYCSGVGSLPAEVVAPHRIGQGPQEGLAVRQGVVDKLGVGVVIPVGVCAVPHQQNRDQGQEQQRGEGKRQGWAGAAFLFHGINTLTLFVP